MELSSVGGKDATIKNLREQLEETTVSETITRARLEKSLIYKEGAFMVANGKRLKDNITLGNIPSKDGLVIIEVYSVTEKKSRESARNWGIFYGALGATLTLSLVCGLVFYAVDSRRKGERKEKASVKTQGKILRNLKKPPLRIVEFPAETL